MSNDVFEIGAVKRKLPTIKKKEKRIKTMRKGIAKRMSAIIMAGAMMAAMSGMSVCAAGVIGEGGTSITTVPVKKTVNAAEKTYAPNVEFSFEVSNGAAQKDEDTVELLGNVVYAGETGGLVAESAAKFGPTLTDMTTTASTYISNGELQVNLKDANGESIFKKPGIYHYIVKEIEANYEGITCDKAVFDVYLYVYNSENGEYYVGNVVSVKNGAKADLAFENDYGKTNDKVHKLTISKTVTGTQGDMNKDFNFTVKINGGSGEKYHMEVTKKDGTTTTSTIDSKASNATSFQLKAGETAVIYGLSETDEYVVEETNYSEDGYITSIDNAGTVINNSLQAIGNLSKEEDSTTKVVDKTVAYTNDKNVTTPTGIVTTYIPYILMLVVAAAAIVLFLRGKKHTEL